MKLSDYAYDLPKELIADQPAAVRGTSRLLVLYRRSGTVEDAHYASIAAFLEPGDLLVLNDTRVIKARLLATKLNGASRELIILEKHGRDDDWHIHKVMYRRSLSAGDRLHVGDAVL